MTIDKQALRTVAMLAKELSGISMYSKAIAAINKFHELFTPDVALAMLDELEALQSFRTAFNEWHDKTEWVQGDKRFDVIKPLGKHRADVLKLYIDHLESKLEAKEEQRANWFQMAQKLGEDLDAAEKRIAELEAKLQTADKLQDSAFRHGLQHGFSLGQTDDQAGFEQCLTAYSSRGKDNG